MANDKRNENWLKSRKISERIVIEGTLVLETPASLSNGDADGDTDISLLKDPYDGRALLTGASIAGALRNYLREHLLDYGKEEFLDEKGKRKTKKEPDGAVKKDTDSNEIFEDLPIITRLFGSLEDDGEQSHLIVDDALQTQTKPETELRDGVRICEKTRTAYINEKGRGAKFDLELLQAGTEFPLRFELLITNYKKKSNKDSDAPQREELVKALVTALQGFENAEIHLGGRKRRGYGQCRVSKWNVTRYDLISKDGLLAWLDCRLGNAQKVTNASSIATALRTSYDKDNRSYFKLTACFALDGSLLIRSGSALEGIQPDTVHLRSSRKQSNGQKKGVPIISGTSLGGVLRHRAGRIAKTIADNDDKANEFVESIFGVDMEELKRRNKNDGKNKQPCASRIEVRETEIESFTDLIQSRVRIDRFTGGAYEGALFDAAPVFSQDKNKKAFEISLLLRSSKESEIGLLLLLLKDLWTGDLAIGGESSIGRGRLRGLCATLERKGWTQPITLKADGESKVRHEGYKSDDKERMEFLNGFVTTLNQELNPERIKENG